MNDSFPLLDSADSADVAARVPHAGRAKNLQLQWLRALAALMVMLFHASVYQPASPLSVFDYRFGVFPVALFFALSGYLMSVAIRVQKPFVFLAHRLVRIYPMFLLSCALFYLAAWLLKTPVPIDWSALSLAPVDSADYPLGIEWTLVFEVSFYIALFFVGLIGLGRHIVWIGAAWLIYLAATSWHFTDSHYLAVTILRVAEDAAMAGGLLIPALLRAKLPPMIPLLVGCFCFLPIYGYLPPDGDVYRWVAGFAAVMIVTGAVGLVQRNPALGDNRVGRLFARFGDYSYALYLCHVPVIRFVAQALSWLLPPSLLWLAAIGLALGLSVLLGRLDIWLYAHLKRAVTQAPPWLRNGGVLLFLGFFALTAGRVTYAWYLAENLKEFATTGAPRIGTAQTPEDIVAVAVAAGWTRSEKLIGAVDLLQWRDGTLFVQGWAADKAKHAKPVALALYQDGVLLGAKVALTNRPDVNAGIHTHMLVGYAFAMKAPCHDGMPVIVIFTEDRRLAAIPNFQPPLACAGKP